MDTEHNHQVSGATIVESFIARKGDPDFAEGAWVLGVRMTDGELWERVKSGELNGFSVDAVVILELLGHFSPQIVFRHYQHVLTKQKRNAVESLPKLFHVPNTCAQELEIE